MLSPTMSRYHLPLKTHLYGVLVCVSSFTSLPIVLKGVLTKEDALLGVSLGVAAIMVSNHGARQLDGVPATVSLLST